MDNTLYLYTSRIGSWLVGGLVGIAAPAVPFVLICIFAVALDCLSAYRLARRIKANHPDSAVSAKFESSKASKVFGTLLTISALIVLMHLMDRYIFTMADLYLANWMAGGFCFIQAWSILENESSENGSSWAKALQRIMVDKAKRYIDIDTTSTSTSTENKKS